MLFNKHIYFMLALGYLLIGCGGSNVELGPSSCKAQIVEKVVVVGCPIKDLDCDFSGDNFEPTKKLLECVKLQKELLEQCAQVDSTHNQEPVNPGMPITEPTPDTVNPNIEEE